MKVEDISSIPVKDIVDRLWLQYFNKSWAEFWFIDNWGKTGGWWFNTAKNCIKDFSHWDRPDWNWFWFVKQKLELDDNWTFNWFKENFSSYDTEIKQKPVVMVWNELKDITEQHIDYLKSRGIEYDNIKDIVKNYNNWIWCLVYENDVPKGLNARTLSTDHTKRFTALSWYSTKWLYQHEIDNSKSYLIVVEWLIDFLTLRQFESNVVWLKSAESWVEEIKRLSEKFEIIIIPDNDEAWKVTVKKIDGIKYRLFDLSRYSDDYKDINDMLKDYITLVGWDTIIKMIRDESVWILPIHATYEKLLKLQEYIKKNWKLGFDWPLPEIFNNTQWIVPWKVYTIGAYSNGWKSKLAYFFCKEFLRIWKSVLFINMEVQEELCFMNIIMSQEKKTYDEVKDFKIDIRTYEKLIIVDNIYKLDDIENIISSNKADIVFIDFCQNIQTKWKSDYEKNADIAKTIQRLAIKTNSTIFNLSQLSNSTWKDVSNWSWDFISLKWSWEYVASSDVILVLRKSDTQWELELKIAKNKFWINWLEFVLNVDFARNQFSFKEKIKSF